MDMISPLARSAARVERHSAPAWTENSKIGAPPAEVRERRARISGMKSVVILISGRGSNMEAIVGAGLPAKVAAVIQQTVPTPRA